jgi:hypothetical protein
MSHEGVKVNGIVSNGGGEDNREEQLRAATYLTARVLAVKVRTR